MDPGVDDALAIMLAVRSSELEIEAITIVGGNVEVNRAGMNALKILERLSGLKRMPDVAAGMARPLRRKIFQTAEHIHGKDGLGDSNLPEPELVLCQEHAVDLIIRRILGLKNEKITIVATGPLSNVASALLKNPGVKEGIAEIVMMGGAFGFTPYGSGNVTPYAEFNVYNDPEAAKIVLESGVPVTAVGLDVTMQPSARITQNEYKNIRSAGTETAKLVERVTANRIKSSGYLYLHDPMTVAVAVDPTLSCLREVFIHVEVEDELRRGQTTFHKIRNTILPKEGMKKPVNVCTHVYGKDFLDLFMNRVVSRDS